MKLKIFVVLALTNLMFSSIFAQPQLYEWESSSQLPVTDKTLSYLITGQTERFQYQAAYDNYGLHMITISVLDQAKLNYYLIDNNGIIIEQNLAIDNAVSGAAICSYKGKVYIISLKGQTFDIYEKVNGVNQFTTTPKYSFTPANYNTGGVTYNNIEAVGLNDHIFFTWDQTNYTNQGGGNIGLARYNIANNTGTSLAPIDGFDQYSHPSGNGNIVASPGKLHVVYSRILHDDCLYTRDILVDPNGDVTYSILISTGEWTEEHAYPIYGSLVYSESTGELFLYTNFLPHSGNGDYRYKKKPLVGIWLDNQEIVWDNFNPEGIYASENQKRPAVFYNNIIGKVGFQFSVREPQGQSSITHASIREYDLDQEVLGNKEDIFQCSGCEYEWFRGVTSLSGVKGDFLIYSRFLFESNNTAYFKIRRPKPFYGDITYNSLLTGNEYINHDNFPEAKADGAKIIAKNGSVTKVKSNSDFTINAGGTLTLESGSLLEVGDNCNIIVDGNNSFIKFMPGSSIKMGTNSKIEVKNNAYLDAEGITFEGNNGAIWEGLVFHNAGGQTKIENCTLKNAKISIDIINTTGCYANLEKKFINNVFDQISSSTHIIKAENVFKVLMQGNIFNIASGKTGVEVSNSINAGNSQVEGGESSGGSQCLSTTYALNILGNTFNNGANQLLMNCNASAVTPFWVHGNNFSSTGSTVISLFGRKITGDIKTNTFTSNNLGNNVILVQSSVNVFNNVMNAATRNFVLATQSTLKMSPLFINNQIVWTAGRNNVVSQTDNINIVATNHYLPILDKGRNCFTVPTGSNKFHIIGNDIDWPNSPYMIRENSWSPNNIPVIHLFDLGGLPINYLYSPTATCNSPSWDGYTVEDMGFGIFDTTFYTSGYAGLPDPEIDEAMYYQAMDSYNANDYLTSINNFKYLIQNYPESDYTLACLYDLYDCYRSLDTSSDETYTINLYSDLKNFLSGIILDETHSGSFEDTAYEIILICDASMDKYNEALTGYEFISMYHPDPEVRFLASADYAEIMAIMGSGQSESGVTETEKINRLERKLVNYVKNDPVANKLNVKFEQEMNKKVVESSREMSSREIDNMSRKEKEEKVFKGNDRELVSKSTTLLMNSRVMNSDERKKFIMEGIFMIAGLTPTVDDLTENSIAPSSYDLTQNYPNPFNPVTNISFSIPVEGLVKLKVFDITGREVAVLVNELRTPGSYNVSFNGSTLSSGVYFYRLEAGSFVETKRMILMK